MTPHFYVDVEPTMPGGLFAARFDDVMKCDKTARVIFSLVGRSIDFGNDLLRIHYGDHDTLKRYFPPDLEQVGSYVLNKCSVQLGANPSHVISQGERLHESEPYAGNLYLNWGQIKEALLNT